MLLTDFRHAWRSLRTERHTTAIAILCLALGIGATALVFSVIDAAVWRSLPCPSPDRLVAVLEQHPQRGLMAVRPANYVDWRDRAWWFERSAAQIETTFVMAGQDRHLPGGLAGEGFFETWGVAPRLGRGFIASDYQHPIASDFFGQRGGVVVLSDAFWRSQFGADAGVIGHAVTLDGAAYTVVGVMPASFGVLDRSDLWFPWVMSADALAERRFHYFPIVARLRPGISREQAQREMSATYRTLAAAFPENAEWGVALIPPRELLLGRTPTALAMLFGAVLLVFVIACTNVSHLLLARAIARRRELAIRVALGCTRMRLVRQPLLEGVLLSLAAAACGLGIAAFGLRLVATLDIIATMPLAFEPTLDLRVFAFTCLIAAASVLLFATIPVWSGLRVDLVEALKTPRPWSSTTGRHQARAVLVIGEVALGVVVAVLTMMMVRSVARLQEVNPGVRTSGVLTVALDVAEHRYPTMTEVTRFYDEMLARVRALPGVRAAAVSSYVPLTASGRTWRFSIVGRDTSPGTSSADQYFAVPSIVSRDVFAVLGIRRLAGRVFEATDREHTTPAVVVSRTAVRRYWPHEDPLAQRIRIAGDPRPFSVIGVVDDVYQQTLDQDPAPALYVLQDQVPTTQLTLLVRTDGDPDALTGAIRHAIHTLDPGQPIDLAQSMDTIRVATLGEPRFRAVMLGCFAGLALLLAAVGIYGVMSQVVGERRHELGVRLALGASSRDIIGLIGRHVLTLTSTGLIVGTLAAAALARVVRGLLFGVGPTDMASFAAAALAFLIVAAVASYVPARRATRVDPMRVLKQH